MEIGSQGPASLTFKLTKNMLHGDSHCEWVVTCAPPCAICETYTVMIGSTDMQENSNGHAEASMAMIGSGSAILDHDLPCKGSSAWGWAAKRFTDICVHEGLYRVLNNSWIPRNAT